MVVREIVVIVDDTSPKIDLQINVHGRPNNSLQKISYLFYGGVKRITFFQCTFTQKGDLDRHVSSSLTEIFHITSVAPIIVKRAWHI